MRKTPTTDQADPSTPRNPAETHDPTCPAPNAMRYWLRVPCQCDLIARTRADTAERIAQAIEAQPLPSWGTAPEVPYRDGYIDGQDDAAKLARALVHER